MSAATKRIEYFVSRQAECMILPLWRQGHDTFQIAKALSLPEYEVANRLLKLRDQHKQMRGGG
jgi:hypothetical protein